jgi:hypothetical protein
MTLGEWGGGHFLSQNFYLFIAGVIDTGDYHLLSNISP